MFRYKLQKVNNTPYIVGYNETTDLEKTVIIIDMYEVILMNMSTELLLIEILDVTIIV